MRLTNTGPVASNPRVRKGQGNIHITARESLEVKTASRLSGGGNHDPSSAAASSPVAAEGDDDDGSGDNDDEAAAEEWMDEDLMWDVSFVDELQCKYPIGVVDMTLRIYSISMTISVLLVGQCANLLLQRHGCATSSVRGAGRSTGEVRPDRCEVCAVEAESMLHDVLPCTRRPQDARAQ